MWSRTRAYPGLSTQNDRVTYAFSDRPMPASYPEYPSGPQVQAYLEGCVDAYGLGPALRLGSRVEHAEPASGGGWTLTAVGAGGDRAAERVDHLVVANGVYCEPHLPDWPGREAYEAAGGWVLPVSRVHDADVARDRNVVVVGMGKSACDIAVPLSGPAASVTLLARELTGKMPKTIGRRVPYKYSLFTRLGEYLLFRYARLRGLARLLHGPAEPLRARIAASV